MIKNLIATFSTLVIFSLIFSTVALAKDFELPDAGTTPDSPFYFVKSWKEQVQLFLIFNAQKKAEQYLHLAGVRLAEYQKMLEKGKTEIADKILQKYEKQLNQAIDKTNELKQKGSDIADLSQKIEETVGKHLEVLQNNLQKVPEQAKKGIENAIENSQKGIEKIFGKKSCAEEGKMCGGIAGILCCSGLKCQIQGNSPLQGNYPDASGTCVKEEKGKETISSFEECAAAGYPIMESYPRQCKTPDGKTFVENLAEPNGICKNLCGDGICQEIVCLATSCPCPETKATCPVDCK